MKHIYFLLIATFLTTSGFSKTLSPEPQLNISKKINLIEVAGEKMNIERGEIGTEYKHIIDLVQCSAKQNSTSQNLKSALANTQGLDSLLIEQWNDSTRQIEPYQMERWTWNDKGQGNTWELYDWNISSAQWIANDKEQYEWDENGNKIVHIDFDPNSISGEWFITGKNDYEFDENGNQIYFDWKMWDAVNKEWSIEYKLTTTYYENGGHLTVEKIVDPISNKLQNNYKEEIINDTNGNMIAVSMSDWDNNQDTWNPWLLDTFTYDSAGNQIVAYYDFISDQQKYEYSYDSTGNLIQEIFTWISTRDYYNFSTKENYTYINDNLNSSHTYYSWNDSTLTWDLNSEYSYLYNSNNDLQYKEYSKKYNESDSLVLQTRIEYVYNDGGERNGEINSLWNSTSSQWLNLTKFEFAKNEDMQLTHEADLTWDWSSADWITETEENHIYDSNGNLTKHNFSTKDSLSNQLIEEWSNDYSYNQSALFSDLIYPAEFEDWHISKLKDFEQYSNVMLQKNYSEIKDNQLATTEVLNFFYSEEDKTAVADLVPENKLKVYPNPASEYVVFNIGNSLESTIVELYNLQGNKISTQQLPGNKQLSVSQLKSGMYIYKLIHDSKISSGKIRVK